MPSIFPIWLFAVPWLAWLVFWEMTMMMSLTWAICWQPIREYVTFSRQGRQQVERVRLSWLRSREKYSPNFITFKRFFCKSVRMSDHSVKIYEGSVVGCWYFFDFNQFELMAHYINPRLADFSIFIICASKRWRIEIYARTTGFFLWFASICQLQIVYVVERWLNCSTTVRCYNLLARRVNMIEIFSRKFAFIYLVSLTLTSASL